MKRFRWIFIVFLSVAIVFVAVFGLSCVRGFIYPVKFQKEISAVSEEVGLDKAIIYSVINIESHFNVNAVSKKGAVGLMQILPSTAKSLDQEITDDELKDPSKNIYLGSQYLAQLCESFGNLETALCAYNAGPSTVRGWLKNSDYSSDGKTLDKIPYSETEKYIKKFNKNFKYYSNKKL